MFSALFVLACAGRHAGDVADDTVDTVDTVDTSDTSDSGDTSDTGDTDTGGADDAPWYCADSEPTVTADGDGWHVTTEHYDLYLHGVSSTDAADDGRMAEAAWKAWGAWFAAEPALGAGERLKVEVLASEADWEAAIEADGASPPVGAGGYYWPPAKTAYLFLQPTLYYDATLLLHEMTHQFHFLARTGNEARAGWYVEGIAEHLSRHDWDGRCVRLGRTPTLTQEDYPALAADEIAQSGLDLRAILAGSASPSRPVERAIVQYLDVGDDGRYAEGFRAFRDAVDADGSVDVAAAFADDVGDPDDVARDLVAWEPNATEPMTPVFVDWVHEGPGHVRAVSPGSLAAARVKAPSGTFAATFAPPEGAWYGGLLVAYDDPSNLTTFLVGSDGSTSVFDVTAGAVSWTYVGSVAAASSYALSADGTTVTVNGGEPYAVTTSHAPSAGLAVYGSVVDFSDVGPL